MLTVTLLGQPQATWNGATVDLLRRQTRALFYRLAVRPEALAREPLCFLFWPDTADATARRNLTRLLTHLRRALPDPDILLTASDSVALDAVRLYADTAEFEGLVDQMDQPPDWAALERAVALYRGSFLHGFSLPGCAEYEAWLAMERRTFERRYLQTLTALIDHRTAQGDHAAAIAHAHLYLDHDELDESIHRRLIELYAASGDRSTAQRQFEDCTAVLEQELGVDPLPETRAAYEAALAEQPAPSHQPVPSLKWATLPGLDLPMVGRDDALDRLQRCFRRAQRGEGGVVLISGEAGIGKSRLVQEFATGLEDEALVLAGAGQPGEQTLPYHPIAQALRRGIHLANGNLGVDPIWLAEASLVLPELRSLHPDLPAPLQTDPAQSRTRLFEALARLTLALAEGARPLLLCLDDLHWTDSATLDWIAYLGEHIRDNRLLVVGTYRKEEPDAVEPVRRRLYRQGRLVEVDLAGLRAEAVHQLLRHADRSLQNGGGLARHLQRATGGNAFFLTEMLRSLLDANLSLEDMEQMETIPISKTVSETVAARLNRLSPVARQMLEVGAVLGLAFPYELVQQTAGRSEMEAVEGLDELVGRHLLRAVTDGFRFHHDIIRVVVYGHLSPWRRQLMHRRAGAVLEAHQPDDVAALAWHFEQVETTPDKAIHYLLQAGSRALRLFAYQEAIGYFTRAVDLLNTLPATRERSETELMLRFGLLDALSAARGFASAERTPHLNRTLALCRQLADGATPLSDRNQLYRVLNGLWGHHFVRAEHETALTYARQSLDLAQKMAAPALLAEARRTVDQSLHTLGRLDEPSLSYTLGGYPMDGLEEGPLYSAIYNRQVDYLCQAGRFLWLWGYPDQGLRQAQAGLSLAQTMTSPFTIAFALCFVVIVHHFRREARAVQAPLSKLTEIVNEHQYPFLQAVSMAFEGWMKSTSGQPTDAVAQIQSAIAAWRNTGAGFWLPCHLGLLAQTWAEAGDVEQGLNALTSASEQLARTGERFWEPELLRLKGVLLLQRSVHDQEEAEACFLQAVAIARKQWARSLELRAAVSLARLWQAQGKRQEARQMLAEIYGWFTEGFGTADLKEAKALLECL